MLEQNQWKITFKPESNKQVQEVEQHFDFYLNSKLDLHEHLQNMFKKISKTFSLLCKIQNNLPEAPMKCSNRFNIMQHLP